MSSEKREWNSMLVTDRTPTSLFTCTRCGKGDLFLANDPTKEELTLFLVCQCGNAMPIEVQAEVESGSNN